MRPVLVLILLSLAAYPAFATNTPCSGKKGGISHCRGAMFVCIDDSTSASKQDCRTYEGGIHNKDKNDPPASEKAKAK
ncbi:YdcA family protein [Xanthobacter versatilis]|uniref:YdcA family protein n=1 Tax=Xanthobacter autotrophicus (strain ATCC BAA-1158 / Py2) TaxID=78245 RepID=UPI003729F0B0